MRYFKDNNNNLFGYDSTQTPKDGLIEITEAEVAAINEAKRLELEALPENQIAKAKAYLAETDYKVLPDYDGDKTGVLEARAEARALIRSLEVANG